MGLYRCGYGFRLSRAVVLLYFTRRWYYSTIPCAAQGADDDGEGQRWNRPGMPRKTGNTLVRSTLVSTGLSRTYVKYVSTLMSGPGYYLPNVPYTMYFYQGYGLHGTYWHSNFGRPMSHGCINLPTPEARWLFNWASVGTLVNIHY